MKRKLTTTLGSLYPVSKGLKSLLEDGDILKGQKLRKHTSVLIPGKDANEVHYLCKGICKGYWLNEDNEEEIFFFWEENSFIILFEDFFAEKKNVSFYITVVSEAELLTLTKQQMDGIYKEYPEAEKLTNIIRSQMMERRNLHISILMKRPQERYGLFQEGFKDLWWRLNDKDICAFLGICRTTLSISRTNALVKDRKRRKVM